jgi:hypothetical protein
VSGAPCSAEFELEELIDDGQALMGLHAAVDEAMKPALPLRIRAGMRLPRWLRVIVFLPSWLRWRRQKRPRHD